MSEIFGEQDAYFFSRGVHYDLYRRLGVHKVTKDGREGFSFAVYAPHAKSVSVIGDFNFWSRNASPMTREGDSGVFTVFVPDAFFGARYKFSIETQDGNILEKADPFAFAAELRPNTASVIASYEDYAWGDAAYMEELKKRDTRFAPMAVYEVHLGSWKQTEDGGFLSYRRLAEELCEYALYMGYTHLELMGIAEYPFDARR